MLELEVTLTSKDILGFLDEFFELIIHCSRSIPSWSQLSFRAQWAKNIPPYSASENSEGGFILENQGVSDLSTSNRQEHNSENTLFSKNLHANQASNVLALPSSSTHLFGEKDSDLEVKILPRNKRN